VVLTQSRILRSSFENLLRTADAVDITATHRAPASSLICSLLLKCSSSPNEAIRQIPWTGDVWSRAFAVHVDRADSALAKSMRKELVDLGKVLAKYPRSREILTEVVIPKTFGAMFQSKENNARVKASFQFLAHFVSKKLINPKLLVTQFYHWQKASGEYADSDASRQSNTVNPTELDDAPLDIPMAQSLVAELFFWMAKIDTAPAAANFLRILLPKLGQYDDEAGLGMLPVWVKPLVSCIHNQPESVIHFRRHLFPELFRSDITAFFQFLRFLIKSRSGTHSEVDATDEENEIRFHIFFSALETGKELGFVREIGKFLQRHLSPSNTCVTWIYLSHLSFSGRLTILQDAHDSNSMGLHDGVVWIPARSIQRLLAHASATIRFAALSLLVLSASPSTPFTSSTFKALRQSLPHVSAQIFREN
jgi:hypothetical protein